MKAFLVCISILITSYVVAQSRYQFGLLPSVNINKKLPNDWKLNAKVESRQELKSGFFGESNDFQYEYLQTDISGIAAKKIAVDKSLAGGYLIRLREKEVLHRFIQQFIIVKGYHGLRLAHRFATDETFQKDGDTEVRLRYRLSSLIPLSGQSVDPKEFYVKVNHEYLNAWEGKDHDLEVRLVPHIGYNISESSKLELGLDYRLDSFIDSSPRHRFWTAINWYMSI
ncbi:DUF2490 domain-containing protein [Aureisphaera galaxeae]|uniref:DUF2490 domain-containing protein n=1 Tax=Aureisphaera galaxeae TaxID=1538023 RepID=UPI002350DF5E|nr:DUF2490 domain-containing protein [Aureisphaera galaxeae]MDC8004081.1 DUF2490 domain-containing protein [Aureisphaera galaxeae]